MAQGRPGNKQRLAVWVLTLFFFIENSEQIDTKQQEHSSYESDKPRKANRNNICDGVLLKDYICLMIIKQGIIKAV